MPKYFLFIAFLNVISLTYSQKVQNLPKYDKKKLHFGFSIGFNQSFFTIRQQNLYNMDTVKAIVPEKGMGFNLGIVSNLHLSENFDLRFIPTLSFEEKSIIYTMEYPQKPIFNTAKKIESTYLDFPLLLKFKSNRLDNYRIYIVNGLKYRYDMASKSKVKDATIDFVKIKRHDLNYEVGIGFDFYLEYFKLSPELKASFGLINILDISEQHIYTKSLNALYNRSIMFSLTFE